MLVFLWESFEQIRLSENGSLTYLWPQAYEHSWIGGLSGSMLPTYFWINGNAKHKFQDCERRQSMQCN